MTIEIRPQPEPVVDRQTTVPTPKEDSLSFGLTKPYPSMRMLGVLVVRQSGPFVLVFTGDKLLTLSTTTAYEVGRDMMLLAPHAGTNDLMKLSINGDDLCLTLKPAKKFALALCQKADAADDFQRKYRTRIKR